MTQFARGDLQHCFHRCSALDLLVDGVQHGFAFSLFLGLFKLRRFSNYWSNCGTNAASKRLSRVGEVMRLFPTSRLPSPLGLDLVLAG